MITDARVLQEEFVPADLEHRNAELNQLSGALDPLLDGEPAEHAFLFGPTGVGKTCTARYMLGQLQQQLINVDTQYVNCWSDYTRFRILYRVLDGIDATLDIHRRSTPKDELLDRLREAIDRPYIVILDEVDQLQEAGVLYDLHRLRDLTMVLISNREAELFAELDERVRSRLQTGRRIQFDRYDPDELESILSARVETGFAPNAVDQSHLRHIADAAAGDARVAIGILRSAARLAEEEDRDRLTDAVIERAVPKARSELKQKTVEKLTEDQRVLYEIVEEAGEIAPGELYARYRERVEEPKSDRTLRKYLTKLDHYNLVRSEGEKRGRVYRVVEQSKSEE